MGLIPVRRPVALGILIAHLLGGCAAEPDEQAAGPTPESPASVPITIDVAAPSEPVTLDCDLRLLEPWFERSAEVGQRADPRPPASRIEFAPIPPRSTRPGLLAAAPVQRWLEDATAAGDVDPSSGLLAAINGGGPIDLTAVMSPDLGNGQALVLRARAERLEFQYGAGIRGLAAYTDDYAPLTDANLYYVFEGLTRDGRSYVSLRLPLAAAALPDAPEPRFLEAAAEFAAITDSYVEAVAERLTLAEPGSFRPPLARLDAFVASIAVR